MTDPERIREACNAENNPELPEGCMHPWCLCNRNPDMTSRIEPDWRREEER